jgi:hypothetical protein
MPLTLTERELEIPAPPKHTGPLEHLLRAVGQRLEDGEVPIRLVVTASDAERYNCEVGTLQGMACPGRPSIFGFNRRRVESTRNFNAALLVPTGIGADIGGHAGDATPVATLLASVCDTLVTHPNVVNASDIIDLPNNALYVEGSVITRLLMGTLGLQRVRNNRLLVALGHHEDELFINAAINSVNAARSSYGLTCPRILQLDQRLEMRSTYTASGRAAGRVTGLESLTQALEEYRNEFDAVAITSQIEVPLSYHVDYFQSEGNMVNPWGGVEAILTHAVSTLYDVPSAHSPMLETQEIANADPGIVDPRMAAEAVSLALLQCILKGLQRSPKIVSDPEALRHPEVMTAEDITCLVIPDKCVGLPTLAALEQGMQVIAVRENTNLMRNDLTRLPWAPGQLHVVDNYWEAAGVMAALRAGIDPQSVRRPILPAPVDRRAPGASEKPGVLTAHLHPF